MEKAKIERINELTHISRTRELSEAEKQERELLRREYIEDFRRATVETLNHTYIVTPDGEKHKLPGKPQD